MWQWSAPEADYCWLPHTSSCPPPPGVILKLLRHELPLRHRRIPELYEWRYFALNGLQSSAEVPLSSQQVEAVLDLLDQSGQATHTNNISAADEVIVALSRSLETSGLLKATKETSIPSAMELTAEEFVEPVKVSAQ
ncbi:hypothetical protein AAII07_49155 [Microvirga sp. 0TCS3.31]